MIKTINTRCVHDQIIKIDKLTGTRIKGIHLAKQLGFPTVNLKLDKPIPCGFYKANTKFGDATIIVGKMDRYRADVHYLDFKEEIDREDIFTFWNVVRIVNNQSDIITTFNLGCC
jgi:FAD synthase